MTPLAKVFIVLATAFSISGECFLKFYGDFRRPTDLACCLTLWTANTVMWVFAYRQHIPLGRSTALGQALCLCANTIVGVLLFSEDVKPMQWFGAACALVAIVLVGAYD